MVWWGGGALVRVALWGRDALVGGYGLVWGGGAPVGKGMVWGLGQGYGAVVP